RGMTYEYGRDRADHRRRRIEAAVASVLAGPTDGARPLLGPGFHRRAGGRADRPRERSRPPSGGRRAHRRRCLARRARSVQVVGLCRARGRPDRQQGPDVPPRVCGALRPDAVHRCHGRPDRSSLRPCDGPTPHGGGGDRRAHPRTGSRRRRRAPRPARAGGGGQGHRPMTELPPPVPAPAPLEVGETWRRLHPLSPIVRFGRVLIGVLVIAVPSIAEQPGLHREGGLPISLIIYLGLLVLGGVGGFISWLVTRWRIAEGNLQIETGFIRRQSLRIPLARIQAVDVISPL